MQNSPDNSSSNPHETNHLNFDYDEADQALQDAVTRFCEQRCPRQAIDSLGSPESWTEFFTDIWPAFAELGLFALAKKDMYRNNSCEDGSGAVALCAAAITLGRFAFPGPVAASFLAAQVLTETESEQLLTGKLIVSLSTLNSTLLPWALHANCFLTSDGNQLLRFAPDRKTLTAETTLGAECWGRSSQDIPFSKAFNSDNLLDNSERGLQIFYFAQSAYLIGAARKLLEEAAAYASIRKQFGTVIGEYQAIAHPLADVLIQLQSADLLLRKAASTFDSGQDFALTKPHLAAARLSAEQAALEAVHCCHQVFAGIGITLEGPAFYLSRRIRQTASLPPGIQTLKQSLLQQSDLHTQ